MDKLKTLTAYICARYPHKFELSKARLTKMVYLSDWKASLEIGRPITGISWIFNHYGPYVGDVVDMAKTDPDFAVETDRNMFGDFKETVRLVHHVDFGGLSDEERRAADAVIEATQDLYWDQFIQLVYSTYPVMTTERYEVLDLPRLAKEYQAQGAH